MKCILLKSCDVHLIIIITFSELQSQRTITTSLKSKQLLPFGFAQQDNSMCRCKYVIFITRRIPTCSDKISQLLQQNMYAQYVISQTSIPTSNPNHKPGEKTIQARVIIFYQDILAYVTTQSKIYRYVTGVLLINKVV